MKVKYLTVLILVGLIGAVALYYWANKIEIVPVAESVVSEIKINPYVLEDNAGCFQCHGEMKDMVGAHAQSGCVSCHQGNGTALTLEKGHENMVKVPGNFADMEETCGACHAESVHHITNSIMATNSGLVNVDRYIFGERETPDGYTHIKDVGQTAADNHLRILCARCHLGKEKPEPKPTNELSRGGGCVACHLNYTDNALKSHEGLAEGKIVASPHHPTMDVQVGNDHCFGCHSRSGRISTNYEGWHETMFRVGDSLPEGETFRDMEDGRVFTKKEEDVHHTLGLQCIDCHVYSGVMGDGKLYMHEEDAVKISCEDCHFSGIPNTVNKTDLSRIEKRIYAYRDYQQSKMLRVKKDSSAIINSVVKEDGSAHLKSKFSDAMYLLSAPSESCVREEGHQDITCSACHSAWAPQCAGCHVTFDTEKRGYDLFEDKHVDGGWVESAGGFFSDLPSLGVYRYPDSKSITNAIPGMIMTLDLSNYPGKTASDTGFHRLFSPAKPHTVSKKGRSCTSCHNSSSALGYGRGTLTFVTNTTSPHWEFESEYEITPQDGLPMDAWIPFLQERNNRVSTRLNYSPFSIEEQQQILTVGACLTCHKEDSKLMMRSLKMDFKLLLNQMTEACIKPEFK